MIKRLVHTSRGPVVLVLRPNLAVGMTLFRPDGRQETSAEWDSYDGEDIAHVLGAALELPEDEASELAAHLMERWLPEADARQDATSLRRRVRQLALAAVLGLAFAVVGAVGLVWLVLAALFD